MKILLIGRTGQLGWELERSLLPLGELIALDYPEIDLTDKNSLRRWIQGEKPNLVVNAAAYTAVDQAEKESELAFEINAAGPGIIAAEAFSLGAVLVHFSTDYVFDGNKNSMYKETDPPNPINVYGESKLAGEDAIAETGCSHFIFRTSWLYSTRKKCFVTKVLNWSRTQKQIRIVTDQIGSPTWSRTLADMTALTVKVIASHNSSWVEKKSGIYHLAGNEAVSRFEWAKHILRLDPRREEQILDSLEPALSRDFPTAAKRPEFSALDCSLIQDVFSVTIPDWLTALELAISSFRP
jgi:dTDP-4-dehydrorhamnose reductase